MKKGYKEEENFGTKLQQEVFKLALQNLTWRGIF